MKKKGSFGYIAVILLVAAVSVLTVHFNGGIRVRSSEVINWGLTNFIDMPGFILIFLFVLPILFGAGVTKDIRHAFSLIMTGDWNCTLAELKHAEHGIQVLMQTVLVSGIYTFVISLIVLICNVRAMDGMEMGRFCANLLITVLPVFYMLAIELLLLPVKSVLRRHVIDYMGNDVE